MRELQQTICSLFVDLVRPGLGVQWFVQGILVVQSLAVVRRRPWSDDVCASTEFWERTTTSQREQHGPSPPIRFQLESNGVVTEARIENRLDNPVAPTRASNLTCGTGVGRDDRSHEVEEPKCSFDCALRSGRICSEDRESQTDSRFKCSRFVSPARRTEFA